MAAPPIRFLCRYRGSRPILLETVDTLTWWKFRRKSWRVWVQLEGLSQFTFGLMGTNMFIPRGCNWLEIVDILIPSPYSRKSCWVFCMQTLKIFVWSTIEMGFPKGVKWSRKIWDDVLGWPDIGFDESHLIFGMKVCELTTYLLIVDLCELTHLLYLHLQ